MSRIERVLQTMSAHLWAPARYFILAETAFGVFMPCLMSNGVCLQIRLTVRHFFLNQSLPLTSLLFLVKMEQNQIYDQRFIGPAFCKLQGVSRLLRFFEDLTSKLCFFAFYTLAVFGCQNLCKQNERSSAELSWLTNHTVTVPEKIQLTIQEYTIKVKSNLLLLGFKN